MNRSLIAPASFALVGAGLVAAYLNAPVSRSSEWILAGAPGLAAAAIVVAIVAHRPVRPVPWFLFAVGLVVTTAASLVGAEELFSDGLIFPGATQAVGILAYPAFFAGIASITSDRRNARDLLAGSEPIIYVIALTALVWLAVTGPYFEDGDLPLNPQAWIWVFSLLDGLLALMALRRVDGTGRESVVYRLIVLGFLVWAAAHVAVGWAGFDGSLSPTSLIASSVMLGPLVLGLVVTMPGMSAITSSNDDGGRVHWSQIFGLLVASLIPLGALILMLATGLTSTSSFVVVSLATVSVIVLALARMWKLVDQVRQLTEQRGHDRLAAMVEHSSDVVMLADQQGRVNYSSPGLRGTLGYDPVSWIGRHLLDVLVEEDRQPRGRAHRSPP